MSPFKLVAPTGAAVPILLSIPHCGTSFPQELKAQYRQDLIAAPDDTDWFVHKLYDFASSMGITMIHAVYSRWLIDLNRDPESKPLYTDGRIITALCPATTFTGLPIYEDNRTSVDNEEVRRRTELYYAPYHEQIKKKLFELKQRFGKALLWECHSIRQHVPTIFPEKFPDLILGDADGTSASKTLIDTAMKGLAADSYSLKHNHPFKGGYITRHFGKPEDHVHALQLEMTKINYMNDEELLYHDARADKMRKLLKNTLAAIIAKLS